MGVHDHAFLVVPDVAGVALNSFLVGFAWPGANATGESDSGARVHLEVSREEEEGDKPGRGAVGRVEIHDSTLPQIRVGELGSTGVFAGEEAAEMVVVVEGLLGVNRLDEDWGVRREG